MKRLAVLLILALATSSCSFSREIRVVVRDEGLVLDFPWSLWRIVGLQDREYPCIEGIELFNHERLLWSLDAAHPSGNCVDAKMPIPIGRPSPGFTANGTFRLVPGHYGVGVRSYATARVDFVVGRDGSVQNITEWNERMTAPCGTYYGPLCQGDKAGS